MIENFWKLTREEVEKIVNGKVEVKEDWPWDYPNAIALLVGIAHDNMECNEKGIISMGRCYLGNSFDRPQVVYDALGRNSKLNWTEVLEVFEFLRANWDKYLEWQEKDRVLGVLKEEFEKE